jgi:hypothetical protein
MVSTGYDKVSVNSENFGKSLSTGDVLLLEGGDKLLLENGIDSLLLEFLLVNSANFAKGTINSTNYTKPADS